MDWSKGFTASYHMTRVDATTWADVERIEIAGGTVSRTISGLRQSADIDCAKWEYETECWVRVYLDAEQESDTAHEPLFTGLASVAEANIEGVRKSYPVECCSVLKPCEDILLERGYYVLAGSYSKQILLDLLAVTPAPVVVEMETNTTSPRLAQNIIAESGENHLSMVNKILTAIGWRLKIDGDGTIRIGPQDPEIRGEWGIRNDTVEPKVKKRADWFKCPNVFRAVSGDLTSVARDNDRNSFLSIQNRGREVWAEDSNAKLGDLEGLKQYAERRLAEEQSYAYSISYTRRYAPDVNVSDVIRLHYPEQGLMGEFMVVSQHYDLSNGAPVQEGVQR